MPRRLRTPKLRTDFDWPRWFRWGWAFSSEPQPSDAEVRDAWEDWRRAVWLETHRYRVTHWAGEIDGLQVESFDALQLEWACTDFRSARVLQALSVDRDALAAFRATPAAQDVGDILDVFAADLDAIESLARRYVGTPPFVDRPHPIGVLPRGLYGSVLRG